MKLYKIILSVIFAIFVNSSVCAQFIKSNDPYYKRPFVHHDPLTLGISKFEVVYETVTKDKRFKNVEIEFRILQIDDTVSVYRSYGLFKTDSVFACTPRMTNGDYIEEYHANNGASNFIKKCKSEGTLLVKDYTMRTEEYLYEEPFSDFNWELTDSVKRIAGYNCHQAKTRFRGRDWTVWYTEEIPIQDGPWKFQGLPGLILRAYDSTGDQYITAIIIRKGELAPIIWERYLYSKTTRERFLKDKREFMDEPWKFFRGYPGPDGKIQEVPKRIRFYNPMELE
ncbi:MAG: GLPGLI family protein [Muribaculaceae bacterium]|nr:GLPGLI family protein [Muribaculaceae bacterium]